MKRYKCNTNHWMNESLDELTFQPSKRWMFKNFKSFLSIIPNMAFILKIEPEDSRYIQYSISYYYYYNLRSHVLIAWFSLLCFLDFNGVVITMFCCCWYYRFTVCDRFVLSVSFSHIEVSAYERYFRISNWNCFHFKNSIWFSSRSFV